MTQRVHASKVDDQSLPHANPPKEIEQRMNAAVRQALNTPQQPKASPKREQELSLGRSPTPRAYAWAIAKGEG